MMRRHFLSLLEVALVTALILGGSAKLAVSETAKKIPKNILIGATEGFTGPYAAFGQGVFGTKAAIEDINKQGGVYVKEYGKKIPLRLITRDTQSDMLKVASLAESLIVREKVNFLVEGLCPPHMRQGAATMAQKYKIPHITGVGPFESWQGIKGAVTPAWTYSWAYGFAIGTPPEEGDFRVGKQGYLMVPTWFGALGAYADKTNKKVAAFGADDPDGRNWYMAFTGLAKDAGYDPYRAQDQFGIFPPGTTDFTPIIREWKKYGCEILWGNAPAPDYGILWRQSRTLGFKPKIVFATRAALFHRDVGAWGGDLPHGVGMETFWDSSIKGAVGIGGTTPQSLAERWFKKTGEPLNQAIGWSYMSVQVILDAIQRAGTLDSVKVNEALSETDMNSMYGRIVFDKKTQFHRFNVQFGQWRKTDKPWKWEAPIVFSFNENIPATADMVFPMPYE
ncbi:MAG: ABC transporter substrate-binding protein [Deltaproteobacteria bacterium]|nr:MAG: ABC transporter substrate-binding protein [Deltaproteobacteria bacterium]